MKGSFFKLVKFRFFTWGQVWRWLFEVDDFPYKASSIKKRIFGIKYPNDFHFVRSAGFSYSLPARETR